MADNYLENQYEQYQARKAAWERERKYGKKKKKSAYPHPLPQQKDAEDVLSVPDEKKNKQRLNEVVFFVEGGLMQ